MNDAQKRRRLEKEYGEEYFLDGTTKEGLKQILKAGVWFTSAGLPAYEWSRNPKRIVVNLWHGIPLKKIVLLEEHAGVLQKLYFKQIFSNKYSYVLTTSTHLVPVMAKSLGVEEKIVKVWGQPRNDMLFVRQSASEILESIFENEVGNEKVIQYSDKFILYAPTFREHAPTKLFPFKEFELNELLSFLEENRIFLCIRMHLYDTTGYEWLKKLDGSGSRIRFLNEDRASDIMEILNVFDLLITDYSSIYIDYLITEKPVLFLPYDREKYLKDRGLNFDYDRVTPGPKPKTFSQFLNSVYDLLYAYDSYEQMRTETNQFFNEIKTPCCGNICDSVRKILNPDET